MLASKFKLVRDPFQVATQTVPPLAVLTFGMNRPLFPRHTHNKKLFLYSLGDTSHCPHTWCYNPNDHDNTCAAEKKEVSVQENT